MNETLLQSAWRAHQRGDLAEAARLYSEILRANPRHFDALYSLGFVYFQSARYDEAERLIDQATQLNPRSADAFFTRGCALQRLNRGDEALVSFDKAIFLKPGFAEALINRGGLLMAAKRPVEALQSFDAALAANPAIAEAWNNRGNALSELGRYEEAISSYDKVLSLKPGILETLINRGTALIALRRFAEAMSSYNEALRIAPGNLDALCGRANALFESKNYGRAAADYTAVLGLDPNYRYARGNLAFCKLHCCDWLSLGEDRAAIAAGLRAGQRIINPFQNISLSVSSEDQLECARIYVADKYPAQPRSLWNGKPYAHDRIRLAYLSADFNEHAVSTLMAGVFERHDKSRFETIAVSFAPGDTSAMRSRLAAAFDRFIEVGSKSDFDVASLLHAMEIDIAVDLMGFTGECRPGIFAYRAAPVQVNYLGFPGTMGAGYMDYIIADMTVIPEAGRDCFSESVAHLPDTYLPNDASRRIAETTPTRSEAGLPERGFVFCSFNNSYKFSPEIFSVWMRLLHGVEESVLWLPRANEDATRNLRREAASRGINEKRLVFAPFLPLAEAHLARLRLADLFLDTLPYNAHTTAADALWAGVPVLTAPGTSFAGRVAASLLRAVGLPEMIAASLTEYESIALNFARDPAALAALKAKLKYNRDTQPLFDTACFTRNLEAAYATMWQRVRNGAAPADFAVAPAPAS